MGTGVLRAMLWSHGGRCHPHLAGCPLRPPGAQMGDELARESAPRCAQRTPTGGATWVGPGPGRSTCSALEPPVLSTARGCTRAVGPLLPTQTSLWAGTAGPPVDPMILLVLVAAGSALAWGSRRCWRPWVRAQGGREGEAVTSGLSAVLRSRPEAVSLVSRPVLRPSGAVSSRGTAGLAMGAPPAPGGGLCLLPRGGRAAQTGCVSCSVLFPWLLCQHPAGRRGRGDVEGGPGGNRLTVAEVGTSQDVCASWGGEPS